ncbi:MAG TPA: hypothetical protein PKL31_08605 [Fulvivirga sp.]|nr:hypothetical protein [Fulvivirga sp.]
MIRTVLLVFIISCTTQVVAQDFPSQVWHDGEIVLLEGDTLKGQVKYSQETDIVEFTRGNANTAIAFSARKVLYFEIFDRSVNRYREFYALPFAVKGDYETPVVFEVILEGRPITILSRERIEYKVVNYPYAVSGTYSRLELMYTYYFLGKDGKIKVFPGSKKDLIWMLKDKSQLIKKFMKANRIRPERRVDLIKTVDYYNSLFKETKTP